MPRRWPKKSVVELLRSASQSWQWYQHPSLLEIVSQSREAGGTHDIFHLISRLGACTVSFLVERARLTIVREDEPALLANRTNRYAASSVRAFHS
jgi:hypothetical protein